MKPLKLIMRAFGPYAGETVIDFDKLEGRHLFLICGPTGAGKTTILDAMCYALYGRTSGDRTGSHMRSDYATGAQKTEVIFDFEIGGKMYRASRSPEQMLNKKRGEGLKKVTMQASLSELENGKEVRTVTKNVEDASSRLLGLNANQFCQVILLPQGDFRKLLVAKAEEREAILKQLFKTQRFSDFQNELFAHYKVLLGRQKNEETELDATLRMAGAADEKELTNKISETGKAISEAKAIHDRAIREYNDFRKGYQKAAVLHSHFMNLEKAEKEQKILLSETPKMEEAKKNLARIRSAKELAAYFENLDKIIADGKVVRSQLDSAGLRKTKAEKEKALLAAKAQELEKQTDEIAKSRMRMALLIAWEPKAKAYGATKREVDRLTDLYDKAAAKLAQLEKTAKECQAERDQARKEYEDIAHAYYSGQAAILAKNLRDGVPCPVCGAMHHPSPAGADKNLPTEGMLKKAEKKAKKAAEDYDDANFLWQNYQAGAFVSAITELGNAQAKLRTLEDVPEEYRNTDAIQTEVARLNHFIQDWEKASRETAEKKEKAAAELSAAGMQYKTYEEQREKLAKDYKEWEGKLTEKSLSAGFKDLAECSSWYKKAGEEDSISRTIETWQSRLKAAEKIIADEKLTVGREPKPDMEALGRKESKLQEDIRGALRTISDGENRKKLLEQAEGKVKEISKRHEETLKEAGLAAGLYSLVRGDKTRVTLERYVLGALLDEVTRAANLRLLDMSHHRYSLHRMADGSTDAKGGLTLEVSDSYTGRSRPANTLSGGETFLASLSLALGLADVVQARQGGVRLDTMFIDEGFGTLDPEALNSAMNTLIDLQNTGRLVGIISHVPELEERIDARLRIMPAEKGSKAVFDVMDCAD
ncbi:SMC family ATPase [Dialister sp.]|uniref:SMC family ATPase n=1 Tax=Dialister sp. TaxID=1955814 RepID=UPI002E81B63B|nr:SMC family ATPase [Dialister sp.]MEE3453476.1 SMC family ATPase [Dialister sp.]